MILIKCIIKKQEYRLTVSLKKLHFILLLIAVTSVFSQRGQTYKMPIRGICAHRGANETHPENTLTAFEEAVRLGAQMIELDVRMTKDNKLIVIHDETVDRTTNGTGHVSDLTWRKIRKLDAGKWKSKKFEGEKIPLFKKILAVFPKNIWLNVHIKGDEKLGEAVAAIIMSKKRTHQVIMACSKKSALGVRKMDQQTRLCNMERKESRTAYIKETIEGEFSTIQLIKIRSDNSFGNDITRLRKHGIRINYFFSNTAEEGIELFDMGVDFILTDRLETMLQAAETVGIRRVL